MRKSTHKALSRRQFLADCGKMTGIGAMSSILSLRMTNQLLAQSSVNPAITGYKGLVCVFLYGGIDSFNLLLPGVDGYQEYLDTRGIVGIPQEDMLSRQIIDNTLSQDFHLNPNALGIKSLYDAGDLSFVSNVGSLVAPTTLAEYNNQSVALPYGRFSHNDQIEQWQVSFATSKASSVAGTGWAGRVLDVLNSTANAGATISPSLSPYGANITQVGRTSSPFLTNGGVDSLDLYADSDNLVHKAMNATLETEYSSVLQSHHNFIRQEAIDQSRELEEVEQNTVINTEFPDSSLGDQLKQIAKYIKANKDKVDGNGELLTKRQTFFAGQTGYDTHSGGLEAVAGRVATVNAALVAFNEAMKEIGAHDEIVTYTASDFGRSLTPNSSGTDHAWGGNQMVMGGPVSGGRVFGTYPEIALNTSTDVGRGRQLPTTSIDQLHASLAHWFGIGNNSDMETILPNIRNFWSATNTQYPIPGLFSA